MATRQRGVVLTYVDDLDTLEDCIRLGGYDTVKVVTGPNIMVEIGNEPNIFNQDDDFIWRWSFFLEQTITHCRKVFPQAKFIEVASGNPPVYGWEE